MDGHEYSDLLISRDKISSNELTNKNELLPSWCILE